MIKQAIIKHVADNLQSDIHENVPIGGQAPDLPDEMRALRPDLVFQRTDNGRQITEIIEVSCPYGYISHEADTLNRAFEEKNAKYRDLSNTLSQVR
jgi:hypothetical protein